jgi:hypothetical protein
MLYSENIKRLKIVCLFHPGTVSMLRNCYFRHGSLIVELDLKNNVAARLLPVQSLEALSFTENNIKITNHLIDVQHPYSFQ